MEVKVFVKWLWYLENIIDWIWLNVVMWFYKERDFIKIEGYFICGI